MVRIRVIVVDDSAFMRKVVSDILESDNRIEVIATARNGEDGLKKIESLSPDVVTMDVHMPVMDGITALEKLMIGNPIPVVMLTSVSEQDTSKTIEAMSKGAVDFIKKPSGPISLNIDSIKDEIIAKVISASEVRLNKSERAVESRLTVAVDHKPAEQIYDETIVSIGSSTGGPRALHQVMSDLPGDFRPPILIVQHMPAGFTKSLANRLNGCTEIHVKEATDGERIKDNTAYVAPGSYHMEAVHIGGVMKIKLTTEKPRNNHRPSVDVLFESVANLNKINKVAVILTGMGNDGSAGIIQLKNRDKNSIIIAESEATSVVYGMPKAAVKTNCVNYIEDLGQVGARISNAVKVFERN
ncbi:protein-glutamate methylesterase/protein-glutamine glutaminase [Oceanobacillus bengalensis]|uniref:Protein-glutamate methylesterase/protein-glutamine glutaminase n=1 Tax=Oceanobacillus bengalensis TaxID=1435466 RepID=A0A494Z472_9BACI|nr:chemotaxis response regulator protein-glutamate methylesterase [Oceanobacillus bengalensis]RKQ17352.1 chemotaxis response regulator protein-glutamate methylesterase [Oceanobacillus bengalensis]